MNQSKKFRLNSWHMLLMVLSLSALALVALWMKVAKPRIRAAEQAVAAASRRLADLKVLSEDDVVALDRQRAQLAAKAVAIQQELKDAGIAELPVGQASVIAAQQSVSQALVQRKLKVVEASASARSVRATTQPVVAAAAAKPAKELTASEYEAEAMKAAACLDASMRGDYIKRVKAQVAKMRAAEAKKGARPVASAPTAARAAAPAADLPFKTDNLACRAQGRFRDVFLFFVDESFKKPSYNFADIAVRVTPGQEETMDLSFTLQANYK